jgi:predicted O-methyltransferase YrrM
MARDGVLIVDDVFFHGDSLNAEPSTEKGVGCRELLDHYQNRTDVRSLLLPLGNGMLIVYHDSEWPRAPKPPVGVEW